MKTEENIVTFINNLEAENQDIECKQCKRILPNASVKPLNLFMGI